MLVEPIHVHCNCKTQIDVQPLIDVQSSNPCPIFTSETSVLSQIVKSKIYSRFSGRCPITSLTYALILTNNSTIDLRIWKGHRFENNLKLNRDLR